MATSELSFRAEIIKSARNQGAHAISVNDRFIAGRPDVYIKMPKFPGLWLELKFVRSSDSAICTR